MSTERSKPTLRSRVLNASSWVLGGHFAGQALRLASNLIMTRLLVPEMFGVMALANVLIAGVALFSDVGLRQNIVQSPRGSDPVFLNTAWTVQIIRGGLIFFLVLLLAYILHLISMTGKLPTDSVYADPILHRVIGVLAFTVLISGFQSTKLATASRNLLMKFVTGVELFSQIAGLVFMISWAMIDRSIWALVGGALFAITCNVILTHIMLPGEKNKLCWDVDAFSDIFHFGKWVFLNSILFFLASNGDRLLLGGLVDASTLGLYAIAFFIVNSIPRVITRISSQVALPALSEVARERPGALKQTYYNFRLPIDGIALFFGGFLFMAGNLVIDLLYDARYQDVGHMVQILAITLFLSRYTLTGTCFLAMGKPKLLVPFMSIRLVAMITIIPLFNMFFGFEGVLWGIALHRFAILPVFIYLKIKYKIFDIKREIYSLGFIFVGIFCGWIFEIISII